MNALDIFAGPSGPVSLEQAALSLLLAFGLSQAVAAVYIWTFRGMSYSRSFVQAVALGSIVAAMLMLAINNNIAAGLGIAGSLAIIRFRTAMRDPRDMVFVFASLGVGIAAGLRSHGAAVLGTIVFILAAVMLAGTEFGGQRHFDGLLRFTAPSDADDGDFAQALKTHTRRFTLVTLRDVAQGTAVEHAYHVRFADDEGQTRLVAALQKLGGVSDVSLFLEEPTVEV